MFGGRPLPAYQYADSFYCDGLSGPDLRELARKLTVLGHYHSTRLAITDPATDEVMWTVRLGDVLHPPPEEEEAP